MKRIYADTENLHLVDHSEDLIIESEVAKKDNSSADDVLLKVIYALDPVTFLPTGDLQVFMSEDASPEVRDYIQRNLMAATGTKPTDSGLSVDEMHALSRHAGESRDAYISRMNDYFVNIHKASVASKESKSD